MLDQHVFMIFFSYVPIFLFTSFIIFFTFCIASWQFDSHIHVYSVNDFVHNTKEKRMNKPLIYQQWLDRKILAA